MERLFRYPAVAECKLVKRDAVLPFNLPPELEVNRRGRSLGFTFKHRGYALGVFQGMVCGFRGKLRPDSQADIVILQVNGQNLIFQRRFSSEAEVNKALAALLPKPQNVEWAAPVIEQAQSTPFSPPITVSFDAT
jgi:hypothetical protein